MKFYFTYLLLAQVNKKMIKSFDAEIFRIPPDPQNELQDF